MDVNFVIRQDICENSLVAQLSELLALRCGICMKSAKQVKMSAVLHDVGKQKIPKYILDKPGKLDKREFEVMKTHTKWGAEILKSLQGGLGTMARETALYHHEWHNGGGYFGRRSGDLPVYVAIISICDVFIALVRKRVYKPAWTAKEALEYIKSQAGTQFNPELAKDFISLIRGDSRVPIICGGEKG